ncbi:MAG TPA: tripartite tricarboxylate transporter substrate binding protein [Burkholderiales bacterium]|nr:tripartite tricarboxylate transporter substrate binding protein [Burkholderiales bacterium]
MSLHSFLYTAGCAGLLFISSFAGAQPVWAPTRSVELVVFAAPGGGNDKAARYLNRIWQENRMLDAVVTNKVGGGGSLAYTYVSQKNGDAHYIAIAQAGLLTNHITGRSPISLADVTVLPYIGTEPVALAVRTDSPYKTLQDFVAQLRKDPASLAISVGSTRGGANHFTIALLAKAAGVDPKQLKILVFGGGSESVTNLLGGHIDAMVQASNNAIPHYQAGKMRILGISTPNRSATVPDVPTFKEQGYDVLMDGWYCFVGPKGMTPAQVAYWDATLQKTVQNEDWKKFLVTSGWEWGYRNSRENAAFLRAEYDRTKALLTEVGMK